MRTQVIIDYVIRLRSSAFMPMLPSLLKTHPRLKSVFSCSTVSLSGWSAAFSRSTLLSKERTLLRNSSMQLKYVCKFNQVEIFQHTPLSFSPQYLLKLNCFNTLLAVVGGLNHFSIRRLSQTWSRVDKGLKEELNKRTNFFTSQLNYSTYRQAVSALNGGFHIPVL